MIRSVAYSSILLLWLPTFGQQLNTDAVLFEERPFFDAEWIRSQSISNITGVISYKRDRFPIEKSPSFYRYEFDQDGKLIHFLSVQKIRKRMDTLAYYYQYSQDRKLNKLIKKDAYGYVSYNYSYDQKNRIIYSFYAREKKDRRNKRFQTDRVIWADSVKIIPQDDRKSRHIFFNDHGRSYREEYHVTDSMGRLILKENINLIGGQVQKESIHRDASGRLVSRVRQTSLHAPNKREYRISYNEKGWAEKEELLKNEKLIRIRKMDYDAFGKVNLLLTRDLLLGRMEIVEFHYQHYP